jgi:metallo-beta-lactamase family protein
MRLRRPLKVPLAAILLVTVVVLLRGLFTGGGPETTLVFFGGAGEVGGSCLLIEAEGERFLVDIGSAWEGDGPVPPSDVSFVVVTHAHLDHCGRLPFLFEAGFRGPVYCTPPTADLVPIMLGMAKGVMRDGMSSGTVARACSSLVPVPFDSTVNVGTVSFTLRRAGHLLGAAFAEIDITGPRGETRIVVSGDLGAGNSLLVPELAECERADYVVIESTYGGITRGGSAATAQERHAPFGRVIGRALERGGDVLIPAFALGRTQEVVTAVELYRRMGAIPSRTLVYVDSPTARKITDIYRKHVSELSPWSVGFYEGKILEFPALREVRSRTSMRLHERRHEPSIFVSSSGNVDYANSPRHLMRMYADRRNLCCIVGYQAPGSTGARLLSGESPVLVRCREGGALREEWVSPLLEVEAFESFSGHADQSALLAWLAAIEGAQRVFIVHGEPGQSAALAGEIEQQLRIVAVVPRRGGSYRLGAR